jgi:hypothetical protein
MSGSGKRNQQFNISPNGENLSPNRGRIPAGPYDQGNDLLWDDNHNFGSMKGAQGNDKYGNIP